MRAAIVRLTVEEVELIESGYIFDPALKRWDEDPKRTAHLDDDASEKDDSDRVSVFSRISFDRKVATALLGRINDRIGFTRNATTDG